jgi:hypothetical protein
MGSTRESGTAWRHLTAEPNSNAGTSRTATVRPLSSPSRQTRNRRPRAPATQLFLTSSSSLRRRPAAATPDRVA